MMELGNLALAFAWSLSLTGIAFGAYAGWYGSEPTLLAARRITVLVALFSFISLSILAAGFIEHDFVNQYIWAHSDRSMPWIYKITAIWGGMDGSMLLWASILAVASGIAIAMAPKVDVKFLGWTTAAINSSTVFFLTICLFLTNPFRYIKADFIPLDGNGLNPLLQNPYMAIHPPMLYFGFTLFAIPFAFCLGALASNQINNNWIHVTRRWSLIAWSFLTAGIVLGGHWAYLELGWGGFWAWDPVENSSFLPWLTATAFVHSVMVQERKGMLKIWNIGLVAATYLLTVFGTFLTRSGVVQSVHAFASTDIGWVFLVYLGIMSSITICLVLLRKKSLVAERALESVFSRETFFLLNNLIFLSICFATLWGVMFPVLSEAVTGEKQAVGIPFFNAINIPLFLIMLLLMAIGPMIAWSQNSWLRLSKIFILPAGLAVALSMLLLWAGVRGFYPILSYCLVFFGVFTLLSEIRRSMKVRSGSDKVSMMQTAYRHRLRFSAYLAHIGLFVAVIGITASMAHKTEQEFSLAIGEKYQVGRFSLSLEELYEIRERNYNGLAAKVKSEIQDTGKIHALLKPELRNYTRNNETTTEVALKMSLKDDLYLVLAGLDDTATRATFKVFVNPLQVWLWIGILIMLISTIMIILWRGPADSSRLAEND
jgi:cytochrome c-type biogenesis protein CcmF